ncbi:MAG: glycosyltransferase family 2 protein [Puniceicoccales bacterium]|jgi:glycosyltransferase involved in cell wall biosynthesis|nr:glycosyltransferase family 2 protein [Puniceicoccales bacterium]
MPEITVIVPVYNVEKYLAECLDTLVAQDFDDYELVVVNDGSTDASPLICREYCTRFPERLRLFEQENKGLSAARNLGLNQARGKYVCFVDSDDWVSPGFLKKFHTKALEEDAGIVVCAYRAHYIDGTKSDFLGADKVGSDLRRQLMLGQTFACNKFFLRELFDDPDVRFIEGICYEDLGTIPLLLARVEKVAVIDDPIYHYRIGRPGAITVFNDERILHVLISLQRLLDFMSKEFLPELEWIAIRTCIYNYWRLRKHPNGRQFQRRIRRFLFEKFPKWKKNTYFKNHKQWRFCLKAMLLSWDLMKLAPQSGGRKQFPSCEQDKQQ